MEFLYELGLFLAKGLVIVLLIVGIFMFLAVLAKALKSESKNKDEGHLDYVDLKDEIRSRRKKMHDLNKILSVNSKKEREKLSENEKELNKSFDEFEKNLKETVLKPCEGEFCPQNLFVLNFNGDTKASQTKRFSRLVDALLDIATDKDEVIVTLKSPGGVVNTYGLASSQLSRIKAHGIKLTVCVDEVAASGGYLMACVSDKIIAAPFAYIGSIGVVASLPNFHRIMDKHDLDYEIVTAGKYKRTLTVFGENTDEARAKFKEELEAIHNRFKEIVTSNRPQLGDNIENIATGEYWLAKDAKELGLIDEIMTSNEYINRKIDLTLGSAIKLVWSRPKKKHMLLNIQKLFQAKSWVKALRTEVKKEDLTQHIH